MPISLKSAAEIEIMAQGGQRLATILNKLIQAVKPGITTASLEATARQLFQESGGEPSFLGFQGYPAATCLSVNEEVVHGIPGSRLLNDGDIIGIDIGLRYQGFCTDMAATVPVGSIAVKTQQLLDVTRVSLDIGLAAIKPGNRIGDIGHAIEEAIRPYRYGIVRDLTGHGIGREPHEEPSIPNFGQAGSGPVLREGMVLAIEPMTTLGKAGVKQLPDGWTIVTLDGSLAAHFEHTIAVTATGYRILTKEA